MQELEHPVGICEGPLGVLWVTPSQRHALGRVHNQSTAQGSWLLQADAGV